MGDSRNSIATRIAAGFALALLLPALLGILTYRNAHLMAQNDQWVNHSHQVLQSLDTLLADVSDTEAGVRGYLLSSDERFVNSRTFAGPSQIRQDLDNLKKLTGENDEQQQHLAKLSELLTQAMQDWNDALRNWRQRHDAKVAAAGLMQRHAMQEAIRQQIQEMQKAEYQLLQARRDRAYQTERRTLALIVLGTALTFVIVLAIGIYVTQSITVPLRNLANGAAIIGGGDLRHRVPERGKDELAQLAAAFNAMASRLHVRTEQLRLSNRELEHANRLKSEFLANMSHELRTPLNSIIGFSELLSARSAGPLNEKQARFVSHVGEAARHLLRLINDILDLSKIEAGQLELHGEDFSLSDILPEVLSIVRPLAVGKGVRLEHEALEQWVHADRVRMKQVLFNLVNNAVKFTPAGGEVRISGADRGQFVEVSVTDTGIGIRPEHHAAIFEEFRQVQQNQGAVKEGTGLGLAISRRLVEEQGGKIWVESEPGRGSRFTFTVLAAMSKPAGPVLVSSSSLPARAKPLVLVVDEEAPARELLVGYLQPAGYDTATAGSHEVLEKARQLRPDAITLNMLTPGNNGWEVLHELKTDPATADIPVVIVSVVDKRKMGFALGASDYLLKPVGREPLLRSLRTHIGPPGTAREKILIAEDDEHTLQFLCQSMQGEGYEVQLARNGREALQALSSRAPAAVLLDLIMPEVDGFEVLRFMQERPELRAIPVFVLTAKELDDAEIARLSSETRAWFHKDSSWQEKLLDQLRKSVQRPAA